MEMKAVAVKSFGVVSRTLVYLGLFLVGIAIIWFLMVQESMIGGFPACVWSSGGDCRYYTMTDKYEPTLFWVGFVLAVFGIVMKVAVKGTQSSTS